MARRKKNSASTVKTRALRRSFAKVDITNGIEESTSGSASNEEILDDQSVVHHKKFGDICVKSENDSISNGDSCSQDISLHKNNSVNNSLDDKTNFKANVSSTDFAPSTFFPEQVTIKTETLLSVLKDFENMNTDCISNALLATTQTEGMRLQPKIEIKETILDNRLVEVTAESENGHPEPLVDPKLEEESGSTDTTGSESSNGNIIRRSTRIRHIGIMKKKERLVGGCVDPDKPVKVKSRWRRSSELEMHVVSPREQSVDSAPLGEISEPDDQLQKRLEQERLDTEEGLKKFLPIVDNEYHTQRIVCRERMTCDCALSKEELAKEEIGCIDDCLNRMLFLECGPRCALGDSCGNKRFQKHNYVDCQIFKTEKKGFGLRADKPIPGDSFIMEYVGEVVDQDEFARRVKTYAKNDVKHFYFMALRGDTVIDATSKGNISRFINHSCDPNAETQKWTVNGELRIGFFSKRPIKPGEEITFDYRFQRYGKEAQKCYCEAATCRGWIGESADDDDDDDEDDEDDDEEDDDEDSVEDDAQPQPTDRSDPTTDVAVREDDKQETAISQIIDMDIDREEEQPLKAEEKVTRTKKPKPPMEKKERKQRAKGRSRRKSDKPVVEDLECEKEIERLQITGLKNRAHTLMLSRLMVRAEDWDVRLRLLLIIRAGDEPCRRLFLDYQGLRFLHSWMQSTITDTTDCENRRFQILKTLQSLPIPNKTMLIESKVLALVESWAKCGKVDASFSPDGNSAGSDDCKLQTDSVETEESVSNRRTSPTDSESPSLASSSIPKPDSEESENIVVVEANVCLNAWKPLKEVFKIPKKERMEQMKEHEREADRGFTRCDLKNCYDRYKLERDRLPDRDRPRNWERDRDREREWRRSRGSPVPSLDPAWLTNSRKMTKQERREMFALQVLQEEEAARVRMQQEELWVQHQARCQALGIDPQVNPTMDPMTGIPIFFDQTTRTWSPNPPPTPYPTNSPYVPPFPGNSGYPHHYPPFPGDIPSMYPMGPPNGMTSSLPYPMLSYNNGAHYPTPSPSLPHTPTYQPNPQFATPRNIIPLTPDPSICESECQPEEKPKLPEDAPILTRIPLNTPIKLPPKWKSAKDLRGFTYYYHVKDRISQWLPPSWTEDEALAEAQRTLAVEVESSSDSSETESEEEEEEASVEIEKVIEDKEPEVPAVDDADTTQPDSGGEETCLESLQEAEAEAEAEAISPKYSPIEQPSQSNVPEYGDERSEAEPTESVPTSSKPSSTRRKGLVQERIISPRLEADKSDSRKYKETKLMLRKRKEERRLERAKLKLKKRRREKRVTSSSADTSSDKKIKDIFKSKVAGAIVGQLNSYRKIDCKIGRIMNNDDFKHLARKLTHIVMLKELKHCKSVDDLECSDSVKVKSRDFVKKYMAKFGPEYLRSPQYS